MESIKKITVKELAIKMAVCPSSATLLLQDIKKEYGIKIVTMSHVIHYLKIPHPLNI
jgi:hypothetical protein